MEQDEYTAIEAATQTVTLAGGAQHVIEPMNISQIAKVGRALKANDFLLGARNLFEGDPFESIPFILEHADKLIEAIAIAAKIETRTVEQMAADDFVTLAGAIFIVNSDFFARRLVPAFAKAAADGTKAAGAIAGAMPTNGAGGANPLPTLLPGAIASPR
jgi:hypothetical protein